MANQKPFKYLIDSQGENTTDNEKATLWKEVEATENADEFVLNK